MKHCLAVTLKIVQLLIKLSGMLLFLLWCPRCSMGESSHNLCVSFLSVVLPKHQEQRARGISRQGLSGLHRKFQGAAGHLGNPCSFIFPVPNTSQKTTAFTTIQTTHLEFQVFCPTLWQHWKLVTLTAKHNWRSFRFIIQLQITKKTWFVSTFSLNFSAVPARTMPLVKLPVKAEPRLPEPRQGSQDSFLTFTTARQKVWNAIYTARRAME